MKPKFLFTNTIRNAILVLISALSITSLSCKKNILCENEPSLSKPGKNVHDKHSNNRHYNDILSNSVIIEWSNVAFNAAGGAAEANTLLASRALAMMHIAIHDALNAIVPVYRQYTFHQQNVSADPVAAAASAAYTVLKASWPDNAPLLDAKLSESLSNITDGPGKTQGVALGMASANAILALRSGDGAYQNPIVNIAPSTVPGVYVAVPPFTFVFAPFWATLQPFALESPGQFRSPPPPRLLSHEYIRHFNEVKKVGAINSTVRTSDQTAYAYWWYEFSDITWNRIARVQATQKRSGLYTTARMFALLNMALADGYIAGWDGKFFYNSWRPYTAIHAAATDGNDQTTPDPNWQPLLPTPPVPDYPSTHCTLGNAAAAVLEYFYGNHAPFSTTTTTAFPAGAIRTFETLKKAANENADSRVMVGIHFRFACDAGQELGDRVGKWTVKNYLEPLH